MAALLLATEVPGVIETLRMPDTGFQIRQCTIMSVRPRGPAASILRPGDRLERGNGVPLRGFADLRSVLHGTSPGDELRLTLRRDGEVLEFPIQLQAKDLESRVYGLLLSAVAVAFLFLGFVTYYRRDDELGHAFFLTCLFLAYPFLDLPTSSRPVVMRILEGLHDTAQVFMPALLLRFLLIFPEGVDSSQAAYRKQRWLLLPPALLTPLHFWSHFAPRTPAAERLLAMLFAATTLVFVVYVVAALWVFAMKIRRRDRWVLWSKLRLALSGLAAGLLPLLGVTVLRQVHPTEQLYLDRMAVLLLPLVPASFSMAMLRTGAIDVTDLRRQLAIGAFVVGPTALLLGLVPQVTRLLGVEAPAGFGRVPLLVGIPALLLVTRLPQRMGSLLADRVLDPELQELRREAATLGQSLSERKSPEEIAEIFAQGLLPLVGADRVTIYLREDSRFRRIAEHHRHQEMPTGVESFRADIPLVQSVLADRELVLVEALLEGGRRHVDPVSRRWLDRSDASVIFPLVASGDVIGMGLLAGPTGRQTYSAGQLYHLQSLAQLAGAALENAQLHQDDMARERLQTELALAHEIQERLLPQESLRGPDFEICGRTVSCREVGGDLFDHFHLSDGRVVVAVADASGKGVPASLLISGLRTSIRETIRPGLPLEEAVSHINRDLHATTQVGHFIAAFLAIYDPDHAELEYAVAGIEPPLWVRASQGRVERLHRGGPVLGIEPDARFRSGIVRLAPEDCVLAYSDGVTDQVNPSDEPFGADRLEAIARSDHSHQAQDLLDAVFRALQAFRGHEIVDDTTLLVLRRSHCSTAGTMSA